MGRAVLSNQLISGLRLELKTKVAGTDGDVDRQKKPIEPNVGTTRYSDGSYGRLSVPFWKGSAYLEGAYYCQGGFTMEGAQKWWVYSVACHLMWG